MTAADPVKAAKVQYDRARREHQRALLVAPTEDALDHTKAYRRLVRYGPSETVVVRKSVPE